MLALVIYMLMMQLYIVMAIQGVMFKECFRHLYVPKLHEWYSQNTLTINASKCEVMIISSKQMYPPDVLSIKINNEKLNQVQCASYLTLKIDGKHTWNEYVTSLCKKISFKLN